MANLKKTSLHEIAAMRYEYLKSLPRFQDIYLEFIINESTGYIIYETNIPLGYVLVSNDGVLLEFHLSLPNQNHRARVFATIIEELQIESILCKSFDFMLLDCCLLNNYPYSLIGCLFREHTGQTGRKGTELTFRFANKTDLPFLLAQNDEVFEPKELLDKSIDDESIIITGNHESPVVACGFLTQVHPQFNYYDLGIWVDEAYRRKGIASSTMQYMIKLCTEKKGIAICGCDIQNVASQNMLEKLGFISKHKLIEFKTKKN
ncbi:MAG TPA: GNAT family N-acetyltransferase [Prolixibacteraceae bacterium]|nr:GNAT family N-acetyltransferase [Prolixibacteraceae bacterium]